MAKYIQVPEIEPEGCLGCPLQHRPWSHCQAAFTKHGLSTNDSGDPNCLNTRTILCEDTPEGRAAYVAARLEASNG